MWEAHQHTHMYAHVPCASQFAGPWQANLNQEL